MITLTPQNNIINLQRANTPSELWEITNAFGVTIWLWSIIQEQRKGHQWYSRSIICFMKGR